MAAIVASAALFGLDARGGLGCAFGFVALVPWLRTLDTTRGWATAFASGWAMSVAFSAAVFSWFGSAIGAYTGVGAGVGLAVLLLGAPLFQPQFLVFALLRHLAGRHHRRLLRALAGAAAWVATERFVPRLLGDTLGQGLYPSALLRQAADLGGTAGLTVVLLLGNEAVAAAIARRADGLHVVARPLALAALGPLLLAGYGLVVLHGQALSSPGARPLRVGLVQANIVDYEQRRREQGAAAVVRQVLDTHFAMSYDAVEHQHVDAVLWSETVYPTTFGHPKSEAGAEFDQQILGIVNAAGVPFVFGTYDRDAGGEYNAAAFVAPGRGLLGFYRKTRLFPLTELVPAWLDGPTLRRWLPWTGTWRPGSGARVFPLLLKDGREIPVLPLICLDDVDTGLGIDGARQGAQAILTLSNDAWFTAHPQGAALHLAAAAFRSIETRLPQFRVTTNGYSAVIDATGRVTARAGLGQRTLVIGQAPVGPPRRTLIVAWGDWVGGAGAAFLVLLALATALRAWDRRHADGAVSASAPALPARVALLPAAARAVAGLLRTFARLGLLAMGAAVLLGEGRLQSDTLAQIRTFAALFLVPEAAAWCVLRAFAAQASIEQGALVFTHGTHRLVLALRDIAAVEPWRLPVPAPGVSLRLTDGTRWAYGIAHPGPLALARALAAAGAPAAEADGASPSKAYTLARTPLRRSRLDLRWLKFGVFPLLLAIPAFRLHEHIAYGSAFGEYYTFGLKAWLTTFALWWAAWAIGVVLCAAALRALIEFATLLAVALRPAQAVAVRCALERLGHAALYLGLPTLLLLRIVSS